MIQKKIKIELEIEELPAREFFSATGVSLMYNNRKISVAFITRQDEGDADYCFHFGKACEGIMRKVKALSDLHPLRAIEMDKG